MNKIKKELNLNPSSTPEISWPKHKIAWQVKSCGPDVNTNLWSSEKGGHFSARFWWFKLMRRQYIIRVLLSEMKPILRGWLSVWRLTMIQVHLFRMSFVLFYLQGQGALKRKPVSSSNLVSLCSYLPHWPFMLWWLPGDKLHGKNKVVF